MNSRKQGAPDAPIESAPGDLAEGTQVGAYVVRRKLGQGGMGTVYLAVHALIHKRVAIKVLSGDVPGAGWAQRFLNEARASVAIDHPNIVSAFEFGQLPDGRLYYMMEYVEGRTLAARLVDDDLDAEETRRLLLQLAGAIEAAHARGIVHRDLKPENVFVAQPDHAPSHVKVLDFGLVKMEGSEKLTRTGTQMGSPPYMAPEQCAGQPVDGRADLYALGVILYEVFAGRLPFDADFIRSHLSVAPPPPSRFAPVPALLERLILDCLEKEPERRPESATVFRQRLIEALGPAGLAPARRGGSTSVRSASAVAPTGVAGSADGAPATIFPAAQTRSPAPPRRATGGPIGRTTGADVRAEVPVGRRGSLVGLTLGAALVAAGLWYASARSAGTAAAPPIAPAAPLAAPAPVTPPPAPAATAPSAVVAPAVAQPLVARRPTAAHPRRPQREVAPVGAAAPSAPTPVEPAPVAPPPPAATAPGLITDYPK